MSAVNSTASAGTTVTGMRRAVAAATSILSGVIDIDVIARKAGFAAITSRSTGSCSRLNRISQARTPAISAVPGDDPAAVGIDGDLGDGAQPRQRAFGDGLGDEDPDHHAIHRTMPATPSTATCAPSGIVCVASRTPSTMGMPRSRASDARCEVEPPSSATTPATLGQHMAERGAGDPRHQDVARCDARELAFAIDHHGAAGAPADAGGMAAQAGMLQPDRVRHHGRLDMERARLQQLEAGLVERPFDLDGHAEQGFDLAQQASQRDGLAGVEARLLREVARHRLGHGAGAVAAGVAVVLAAGHVAAQEALAGQHDAVRHHLALGDRRAEPPGGAEHHLAFGVLAQPAAGGARLDQRLDQHRHRGVGRAEPVVFHVAARIGGP